MDPIQFTTELFVVLLDSVDFGCHLIVEVVELLVEILQQVHKVSLSTWSPSTGILFYLLILGFGLHLLVASATTYEVSAACAEVLIGLAAFCASDSLSHYSRALHGIHIIGCPLLSEGMHCLTLLAAGLLYFEDLRVSLVSVSVPERTTLKA